MGTFTNSLKTEWLPSGKWRVTDTFEFHSGREGSGLYVRVLKGFVTDLASIPFLIRWLIPKSGKNAQAAAFHDVIYQSGVMIMQVGDKEKEVPASQGMADALMNEGMRALSVVWWRRQMIYRGLQVGGWVAWNDYRDQGAVRTDTTK